MLTNEMKEKGKYIELEVPVRDNYTLFVAMTELGPDNINYLGNAFFGGRSCIIATKRNEPFSSDFLQVIPQLFMDQNGHSCLNYVKLIGRFCPQGDVVCRFGGDGGDEEISFQIFCQRENKDSIYACARRIVGV